MRKLITTLALTAWLAPNVLGAQDVRLDAPDASEDLRTALTAASLSLALSRDGADASQDYVAAARADYRRLLTGLYSQGYYGGTISILVDGVEASQIDPLIPRSSVSSVVLSVSTGPQFTFGRAEIAPLARGTELPEAFSTGNVARSDDIGDAASAAVSGWRNVGHPLADTTGQSITARHPDEQLDVSVIVDPGPELTFGNITVTGNAAVRTERVLAIAGLPTGTFDPAMITRAETNLRRTGAFRSAAIIEGEAPNGTTLPLTLTVVEQTPRRVRAGIEYSTVSGLTLSGFWLHRNLLGGAERFRVDGEITGLTGSTGGIDYALGATFLRPATFRQDTDFYANAQAA
ncbi:MAG: outer membrane protein assembly factor, partial [Octadecabacter sp.]|nr:outer membrane protein assembly factor [Octadecabacter sp.]